MKTKFTLLSVGMTVLAALSLLGTLLWRNAHRPVIPAELQPQWEAAVSLLEKGNYRSARDSLVQWIAEAHPKGIDSPEAYYNLSIAHWEMKEPGPSASALLNSLLLSQSLSQIARSATALARMQIDLGISDGITRELRFQARVWLTDNGLTFLMMLAFWSLIGVGLWFWRFHGQLTWLQRAGIALGPIVIFAVAGTGLLHRDWKGSYGVLDTEDGTIGLYPDPRLDTQEKLLDLPSGTLVHSSGEAQNGFIRIDSPLVAWVQTGELKLSVSR